MADLVPTAEQEDMETVDAVARAIRDAYEELPDGTHPEFTDVHEWRGEARAAIGAYYTVHRERTRRENEKYHCTVTDDSGRRCRKGRAMPHWHVFTEAEAS